jgi:hypothetical protein
MTPLDYIALAHLALLLLVTYFRLNDRRWLTLTDLLIVTWICFVVSVGVVFG